MPRGIPDVGEAKLRPVRASDLSLVGAPSRRPGLRSSRGFKESPVGQRRQLFQANSGQPLSCRRIAPSNLATQVAAEISTSQPMPWQLTRSAMQLTLRPPRWLPDLRAPMPEGGQLCGQLGRRGLRRLGGIPDCIQGRLRLAQAPIEPRQRFLQAARQFQFPANIFHIFPQIALGSGLSTPGLFRAGSVPDNRPRHWRPALRPAAGQGPNPRKSKKSSKRPS